MRTFLPYNVRAMKRKDKSQGLGLKCPAEECSHLPYPWRICSEPFSRCLKQHIASISVFAISFFVCPPLHHTSSSSLYISFSGACFGLLLLCFGEKKRLLEYKHCIMNNQYGNPDSREMTDSRLVCAACKCGTKHHSRVGQDEAEWCEISYVLKHLPFKTYVMFISGIFHVVFLDSGWHHG